MVLWTLHVCKTPDKVSNYMRVLKSNGGLSDMTVSPFSLSKAARSIAPMYSVILVDLKSDSRWVLLAWP